MLRCILQPALVIFPYVAFSTEADRLDDQIDYVARVTDCSPTEMTLEVLNGAFSLTFDADGRVTQSPIAEMLGQTVFIQWQGFETHQVRSEDFYADMLDHASANVRSGHAGPLTAPQLASCDRLGTLTLQDAAARLATLGDTRLQTFLAAEYPQIRR